MVGYRFPASVWTEHGWFVWGGSTLNSANEYCLPECVSGGLYPPGPDSWTLVSPAPFVYDHPVLNRKPGRYDSSATVAGGSVLLWGGNARSADTGYPVSVAFADGALYDLEAETWTYIEAPEGALPRPMHAAVATEQGVFIWGGYGDDSKDQPGGRLNAPELALSGYHYAWTGKELLVRGDFHHYGLSSTFEIFRP